MPFKVSDLFVYEDYTLIGLLQALDRGARKICLLVDKEGRLLGTITDGDARRAIIRGAPLNAPIGGLVNHKPFAVGPGTSEDQLREVFAEKKYDAIPVVDSYGRVINIHFLTDIIKQGKLESPAVIMAGGLGSRLGELTKELPKPMLKIGGEPLLSHVMRGFKRHGYTDIYLSVNYKAEFIENYFQNGEAFGLNIKYIREQKRLGTGGSVRLCGELGDLPFFVANGDILTSINLNDFMRFHINGGYDMTVAVKPYSVKLDYGVLDVADSRVKDLKEKPELNFLINAGYYCLNPEVTRLIPEGEYFELTQLFGGSLNIGSYEIKDYWMDIGRIDDYFKANQDYNNPVNGLK